MKLVFASNNKHKLEEVRAILTGHEVLSLNDIGFNEDIAETGTTLEANSLIKARTVTAYLQDHPQPIDGVFSDDTGLEIDALNGQPGVYTARWAGEPANDANNRHKALTLLQNEPCRTARFRTVITLIRSNKEEQVEGRVEGRIATQESGNGGFGYDPVFIPDGYDRTFAELPAEVKNKISHRARAMQALRKLLLIVGLFCWLPLWAEDETEPVDYGAMFQWESYASYYDITEIARTSKAVFCLSDGAVFSLDSETKEITRWNKQNGLNGGKVTRILSVPELDRVLFIYDDNMLDIIDTKGRVLPIRDLYQTTSKTIKVACACVYQETAYIGTDFGIIAINLKKREVADTYYIGEQAQDVMVNHIAVADDSIFAFSSDRLYKAPLQGNLINYNIWQSDPLAKGEWKEAVSYAQQLWAIKDSLLLVRQEGQWKTIDDTQAWTKLCTQTDKLFAFNKKNAVYEIQADLTYTLLFNKYTPTSAAYDAQQHVYWITSKGTGLIEWDHAQQNVNAIYVPQGPFNNHDYALHFAGEKLFVCPGSRWSSNDNIDASFSFLSPNGNWGYEPYWRTNEVLKTSIVDLVAVAVDPQDDSHFFMCSYGNGVIEYRKDTTYKQYTEGTSGCTLLSLVNHNPNYVRTEGAMVDDQGYLWVFQPENQVQTAHLMNLATGQWTAFNLNMAGKRVVLNTPKGTWMDKRNPQYKWLIDQRNGAGIVLLDDNGTPANPTDDHCVNRNNMQDQNGNNIQLSIIYDWAQDKKNDIWVGLEGGLIIIPSDIDFMTSNLCHRVIIPRNDGTGLADYLLSNDNVRAIAVDGGNRKWLGTENSGVYLVSEDGLRTIHHFTAENSPLPSNYITDIAINPTSGEVFIGTDAGLISFRSDASEPAEDYQSIIAYPNPIRPNYDGVVTISGLTDGTVVNIIDQGAQLVCKANANGGTVVWDLKNGDGKRVSSGIYTALCNDTNGNHQIVKIMVMNR